MILTNFKPIDDNCIFCNSSLLRWDGHYLWCENSNCNYKYFSSPWHCTFYINNYDIELRYDVDWLSIRKNFEHTIYLSQNDIINFNWTWANLERYFDLFSFYE